MYKSEFEELHGAALWQQEVAPRQGPGHPHHIQRNANVLVHNDMVLPWIRKMSDEGFIEVGSAGVSLLQARANFIKLHPGKGSERLWNAVLAYCRRVAPKLQSEIRSGALTAQRS